MKILNIHKLLILAILLFPSTCSATEVISSFDEENLSVLNEELRKITDTLNSEVSTLETSIAAVGIDKAIGVLTHDVSVTGTQAITGVGFQPTIVIFLSVINATQEFSVGVDDGTTARTIYTYLDNFHYDGTVTRSIRFYENTAPATYATAYVTALGTDGFTITWEKTGSPTGTASVIYLCLK